jgi:hypothetical protein
MKTGIITIKGNRQKGATLVTFQSRKSTLQCNLERTKASGQKTSHPKQYAEGNKTLDDP